MDRLITQAGHPSDNFDHATTAIPTSIPDYIPPSFYPYNFIREVRFATFMESPAPGLPATKRKAFYIRASDLDALKCRTEVLLHRHATNMMWLLPRLLHSKRYGLDLRDQLLPVASVFLFFHTDVDERFPWDGMPAARGDLESVIWRAFKLNPRFSNLITLFDTDLAIWEANVEGSVKVHHPPHHTRTWPSRTSGRRAEFSLMC